MMTTQEAVLAGASIGLTIAAPIGPMAVIVIRRTLAGGVLAGLATGAGASTVHLIYASLALGGVDAVAAPLRQYRPVLGVLTAAILVAFAVRMLRRRLQQAARSAPGGRSLLGNYASAVAVNSLNPIGFVLLLGATAAFADLASGGNAKLCAVAAGVFLGSILWWCCLVSTTATVGVRLSPFAVRAIDVGAGLLMLLLAAMTIARMV